jgi:hypothetical protein
VHWQTILKECQSDLICIEGQKSIVPDASTRLDLLPELEARIPDFGIHLCLGGGLRRCWVGQCHVSGDKRSIIFWRRCWLEHASADWTARWIGKRRTMTGRLSSLLVDDVFVARFPPDLFCTINPCHGSIVRKRFGAASRRRGEKMTINRHAHGES